MQDFAKCLVKICWARGLVLWQYWESHGGIDSFAAHADLSATVILGSSTIVTIENKHAAIRRECFILGTQTVRPSFTELSNRFVIRNGRVIVKATTQIGCGTTGNAIGNGSRKRNHDVGDDEGPPGSSRKLGGWRAYLHHVATGEIGGCTGRNFGAEWKA